MSVKSLTCDKLSHCLFDFDCADLSSYDQELYNFQEFHVKDLYQDTLLDEGTTKNDSIFKFVYNVS